MFIAVACLLSAVLYEVNAAQNFGLKTFEIVTLQPIKESARQKRDIPSEGRKKLRFDAYGRSFDLTMDRGSTGHVRMEVQSDDKTWQLEHEVDYTFRGTVNGNGSWPVRGSFLNGELFGSIGVENETYFVEPAARFGDYDPGESIVYRLSDLETVGNAACSTTRGPTELEQVDPQDREDLAVRGGNKTHEQLELGIGLTVKLGENVFDKISGRLIENTCAVQAVADYKFFWHVGNGDADLTAKLIVASIDRISEIYENTVFTYDDSGSGFTGLRISVGGILIHTQASESYNADKHNAWPATQLIQTFALDYASATTKSPEACVYHLFTYDSFVPREQMILGMAYPRAVCRSGSTKSRYYRTGFTSYANIHYGLSVSLTADLVTAHEIGHNLGSSHDDDTDYVETCFDKKHRHIMSHLAVPGTHFSNREFSNCSRDMIGKSLVNRGMKCFKNPEDVGNWCVGGDKECRNHYKLRRSPDLCCSKDCKLRTGMQCSPSINPCCTESCQFMPEGSPCGPRTFINYTTTRVQVCKRKDGVIGCYGENRGNPYHHQGVVYPFNVGHCLPPDKNCSCPKGFCKLTCCVEGNLCHIAEATAECSLNYGCGPCKEAVLTRWQKFWSSPKRVLESCFVPLTVLVSIPIAVLVSHLVRAFDDERAETEGRIYDLISTGNQEVPTEDATIHVLSEEPGSSD